MKKQILILFIMLFAGVATVYGQNTAAMPGSAPRDIVVCDVGPLNPIAGESYDYQATFDPTGGTAYWYATLSEIFMQEGNRAATELIEGEGVVGEATNYRTDLTGDDSEDGVSITWTTSGLAAVDDDNPLFVVVEYNDDDAECPTNNLKVFKIDPIMPFLVNVLPLDHDGTENSAEYGDSLLTCFSDVWSAEYDGTANGGDGGMLYDYGQNYLGFEVVAAYFDDSYLAEFRIEGLVEDQVAEVYWSYDADPGVFDPDPAKVEEAFDDATHLITLSEDGIFNGPNVSTDAEDTSGGVSIYVWIVIKHGDHEGLTDQVITFAAAGETPVTFVDGNPDTYAPNVRWDDCLEEVDITLAFNDDNGPDYAESTLTRRPTITPIPDDGTMPFIEPAN